MAEQKRRNTAGIQHLRERRYGNTIMTPNPSSWNTAMEGMKEGKRATVQNRHFQLLPHSSFEFRVAMSCFKGLTSLKEFSAIWMELAGTQILCPQRPITRLESLNPDTRWEASWIEKQHNWQAGRDTCVVLLTYWWSTSFDYKAWGFSAIAFLLNIFDWHLPESKGKLCCLLIFFFSILNLLGFTFKTHSSTTLKKACSLETVAVRHLDISSPSGWLVYNLLSNTSPGRHNPALCAFYRLQALLLKNAREW